LFGFWLIIAGLKYTEASKGELIGLLEIVFTILFELLLFGETLTPKIIAGGLLIIVVAASPHIGEFYRVRIA